MFFNGSPDWIRTNDLPVTLILMFPSGVDYIFTMGIKGLEMMLIGALVSSLYGALPKLMRSSLGIGMPGFQLLGGEV